MIVFNNVEYGYRIARAAGAIFNPAADQCIAREEGGVCLGGVIYQNFTGASIGMHVAGFRGDWINRDMLWVAFDYPFRQLGVRKVFGQVPETNSKALEFHQKIGFKIVTRIEDVFPDGACLVVALAREDCRWLNLKPRGFATA